MSLESIISAFLEKHPDGRDPALLLKSPPRTVHSVEILRARRKELRPCDALKILRSELHDDYQSDADLEAAFDVLGEEQVAKNWDIWKIGAKW